METDDLRELRKLKSAVEDLGYSAMLQTKSELLPIDMISVTLEEDAESIELPFMTISIYPLGDELDGSNFIQFYFQYPFEIDKELLPHILKALPIVNQRLPLGHFNISEDETSLYFKYVLALPKNQSVKPLLLNDVLDMCVFARNHFLEEFKWFFKPLKPTTINS